MTKTLQLTALSLAVCVSAASYAMQPAQLNPVAQRIIQCIDTSSYPEQRVQNNFTRSAMLVALRNQAHYALNAQGDVVMHQDGIRAAFRAEQETHEQHQQELTALRAQLTAAQSFPKYKVGTALVAGGVIGWLAGIVTIASMMGPVYRG